MIFYYKKDTGDIFAVENGRVHDERALERKISDGAPDENIGKYIIGWEETDELENYEVDVEALEDVGNGLFRKVVTTEIRQRRKKIEHNLDKFDLLQRFEDTTPENPFEYRIEENNFVKK